MSKSEMLPELPSADAGKTHIPRSPRSLTPLEKRLTSTLERARQSLTARGAADRDVRFIDAALRQVNAASEGA